MKADPSQVKKGLIRRDLLKAGGSLVVMRLAAAAGLVLTGQKAFGVGKIQRALDADSLDSLVNAFGGQPPELSDFVIVNAPDVAEDGFMVSLGAESLLPETESISLLVANNPAVLAAHFVLRAGMSPKIDSRVKTSGSGKVIALVKAQGRYFYAEKDVKVIAGGCGT